MAWSWIGGPPRHAVAGLGWIASALSVAEVTVIAELADTLRKLALTVALPGATAVTRPPEETVATDGTDDCHVLAPVASQVAPSLM